MIKESSPVEIDAGDVFVETFDRQLICAINKIKGISNPYVGNKRKLLFSIFNELHSNNIRYNTVLDLFSGSACVSILMKLLGKRVIANDLLASSCVYSIAFVENNDICLLDDEKQFLLEHKSQNVLEFVQENYMDKFTVQEAIFLDNFKANVLDIQKSSVHGRIKSAIAMANLQLYIMDHCFVGGRLNRGQVLAKLGHRMSHNRNKKYLSGMKFHDIYWYSFNNPNNKHSHVVYNLPASQAVCTIKDSVDVAYIDPPYGGAQSDYVAMYKFFEEFYIGRRLESQDPQVIYSNEFSNTKQYEHSFITLIESLSNIPVIILSYNDSSWAGIEKLKDILLQYRREVNVIISENYEYKYRDARKKIGKEYIILATGAR